MNELEFPGDGDRVDPDGLYLYRGSDVSAFRPYLTGDVFDGIKLIGSTGKEKKTQGSRPSASMLHAEGRHRSDMDDTRRRGRSA